MKGAAHDPAACVMCWIRAHNLLDFRQCTSRFLRRSIWTILFESRSTVGRPYMDTNRQNIWHQMVNHRCAATSQNRLAILRILYFQPRLTNLCMRHSVQINLKLHAHVVSLCIVAWKMNARESEWWCERKWCSRFLNSKNNFIKKHVVSLYLIIYGLITPCFTMIQIISTIIVRMVETNGIFSTAMSCWLPTRLLHSPQPVMRWADSWRGLIQHKRTIIWWAEYEATELLTCKDTYTLVRFLQARAQYT